MLSNPLSLDEIKDIHTTILAMEAEIHNPGAANYRGHDLLADIEDALYRLADVIERTEALQNKEPCPHEQAAYGALRAYDFPEICR